jgi:UDP-2,4-diacetamido-2,4,6-trideoxy-beta-L-altropyranose hydrolase
MRIAFLPDGGPKSGLGHLGRCVAIAWAIRRVAGQRPVFVIGDAGGRAWVRERGFRAEPSLRGRWDLVILDSYLRTESDVRELRKQAVALAVIDDRGRVPKNADWVINTTVRARRFSYTKARPGRLLLGPKFHPLRTEFASRRPVSKPASEVRNVLISVGGTDGRGLITNITEEIKGMFPEGRIHVLVGPFFSKTPRASGRKVVYHRSPANLRAILSRMDLAISAAGQTLFELAYMGIPTMAIEIAPNQRENIKGFSEAGAVHPLGRSRDRALIARLRTAFRDLVADRRRRQAMSAAGRRLVDGRGGDRLAKALIS